MIKRVVLGDGLLVSELVRQTGWGCISRKEHGIDFTKPHTYEHLIVGYDEVINCIAHTDTYEDNKQLHWDVNYAGTADLVDICNKRGMKLVHISTDYLYTFSDSVASESEVPTPCNTWYGYTKLLADAHVQLKSDNFLIARCTHKPYPFPYKSAYVNLIGNFDYVDKISELIVRLIESQSEGVYNIGTELKSMYDLAKRTKPDVTPIYGDCHKNMPTNVSMDVTKLESELKI